MKISILLPFKENFSPSYAGAVSLNINDILKYSKFKKNITVFGYTKYKKREHAFWKRMVSSLNNIFASFIYDKPLNISQLSSLIKDSLFVISNDTGPAHISAHLNKKGLALFGSHTTAVKAGVERKNFRQTPDQPPISFPPNKTNF